MRRFHMLRKILLVVPFLFLAACGEGVVDSTGTPDQQAEDLASSCIGSCYTQYRQCNVDPSDQFQTCLCHNVFVNCERACGINGVLQKCAPYLE